MKKQRKTKLRLKQHKILLRRRLKKANNVKNQTGGLIYDIYSYFFNYPTPPNLTTNWNWGFLAFFFLIFQIITGFLLSMHYIPTTADAFWSVNKIIMRDVKYGHMLRYFHSNGASFFFGIVYLHIARALYFNSFLATKRTTWIAGVLIYLLMCFTAFTGYVLPWGQMSYWAAIVITSLTSATPIIGPYINTWVWGNFSVDSETLHRFFSLHYLSPFAIFVLVVLHIILLHQKGSSNRLKAQSTINDKIIFGRYYILKDFCSLLIIMLIFFIWVAWKPNYLAHPDNYNPANPSATPEHIVPEWYFLPYYAMLRSVPDKTLGIIILLAAISILFIFPFCFSKKLIFPWVKNLDKINRNFFKNLDKPKNFIIVYFARLWKNRLKFLTWLFIINFALLGYIGAKPVAYPYDTLGLIFTIFYFLYFILLIVLFREDILEEDIKKFKKKNTLWQRRIILIKKIRS